MNSIDIHDSFISESECKIISEFILSNENYVKSLGPDIYPATSKNSLTGRYSIYNYLHYFPGQILVPKLKLIIGECLVQCWSNIFRLGEGIKPHLHGHGFISGNLFLSGPSEGTVYGSKTLKNKKGSLVLFPSETIHSVHPNIVDEPRISMAFDIFKKMDFDVGKMFIQDPRRFYLIE